MIPPGRTGQSQICANSQKIHDLAINSVIYSKLSLTFEQLEDIDAVIEELELKFLEIPRPALLLAGKVFAQYRRQGVVKMNVLSDYFAGAHVAVMGYAILTRDNRRYCGYFASVELVSPTEKSKIQAIGITLNEAAR